MYRQKLPVLYAKLYVIYSEHHEAGKVLCTAGRSNHFVSKLLHYSRRWIAPSPWHCSTTSSLCFECRRRRKASVLNAAIPLMSSHAEGCRKTRGFECQNLFDALVNKAPFSIWTNFLRFLVVSHLTNVWKRKMTVSNIDVVDPDLLDLLYPS